MFLNESSLCKINPTDHKLTTKHTAFFHRNFPRCDIAFECAFLLNLHGLGSVLSRHPSLDFDAFLLKPSKAMNIGFAIDAYSSSADPPRHFLFQVDRLSILVTQYY